MVVQHNLTAMNSNRMLGITTGTQAKSTEKLSSGYKINRAADDAAGLSISEKMRKQIRGLTQASLNAEDGISAVQTAEGALNEVQDMLQRANELAVKAANGTMSENDRNYIQDEIDQLMTEINRVSTTTKFNETYLLKGDAEGATEKTFEYVTTAGGISGANGATLYKADGTVATVTEDTIQEAVDLGAYYKSVKGDTAVVAGTMSTYVKVDNGAVKYQDANTKLYDENGNAIAEGDLGTYFGVSGLGALQLGAETAYVNVVGDEVADDVADFEEVDDATAKLYDANGAEVAAEDLANYFNTDGTVKDDSLYADDGQATEITDANLATYVNVGDKVKALTLSLHVGADSTDDNQISVDIDAMSAKGLGLLNDDDKLLVNGADDTNARAAIDTIAKALQQVSTQRSALGAVQNRLEHTIANLDNVVENTTAAESQIRDTDMATEMVKYSNNNILAQAGQAMLAQANQANQGVLSLLG